MYSLLVSKLLNFSKDKKQSGFPNNCAFIDQNKWSPEGPNH